MDTGKGKRFVIFRMDKIGDLVSSLPIDQIPQFEQSQVTWVIFNGMHGLIEHTVPKRSYFLSETQFSFETFFKLKKFLAKEKVDAAVVLQAPWWISFLIWLLRIPIRVGPSSKLEHILFLNRRVVQKRSQSVRHEADYNFELIQSLFPGQLKNEQTPILSLEPDVNVVVPQAVLDLERHSPLKKYIVVHAGMAGSALNWPQEYYIELINEVIRTGCGVILTGTETDLPYWTKILPAVKNQVLVLNQIQELNFKQLILVLSKSAAVVAPSTGVAHLAAALNRPVLSFFPPIRVQSQVRWAPRSKAEVIIFEPQVTCPEQFQCRGEACSFYPCMNSIQPLDPVVRIKELISKYGQNEE